MAHPTKLHPNLPADIVSTARALHLLLLRDVSTLTGVVCLVTLSVGAVGWWWLAGNPVGWLTAAHAAAYPYGMDAAATGALDALRRLCGVGMLLVAVTGHTLLDFAWSQRQLDTPDVVKARITE